MRSEKTGVDTVNLWPVGHVRDVNPCLDHMVAVAARTHEQLLHFLECQQELCFEAVGHTSIGERRELARNVEGALVLHNGAVVALRGGNVGVLDDFHGS